MSITDPSRLPDRQNIRNATFEAGEAKTLAQQTAVIAGGLITRSPAPPSGVGVADGALWLETGVDGIVIHQWDEAATAWVAADLDPTVIASAIIGQLAAGVIDTTEVTIRSGEAGARVVLDGDGLRGYNAANQLKTNVGSDGTLVAEDATVVGTFRNAPVGQNRLEMRGGAGWQAWLAFVSSLNDIGAQLVLQEDSAQLRGNGSLTLGGRAQNNASGSVVIVGNENSGTGVLGSVTIRGNNRAADNYGNINLTGNINFTDTATKQSARNSLGLGNTTGALPVANGGTGASTARAARDNLGLGDYATWDTGWVTVTLAAGFTAGVTPPQVRRVGHVVYWRGSVILSTSTGGSSYNVSTAVPAWANPQSWRDAVTTLGAGTSANSGTYATVGANTLIIRPLITSATNQEFFLKGLSGYLVDEGV